MKSDNNDIAILILAAGSSSRLGEPKQLLDWRGNTLLQHAIKTALQVSVSTIVVLGANEKMIRPTITDFPISIVLNEKWEEGMSSSIRAGMNFLKGNKYKAVLIMLCDQPFVNVLLLRNIISVFKKNQQPIVACEYNSKLGVPALFDFSFFKKLKDLKGQSGAKGLIMSNLESVKKVVFEKGKMDVDTQEDWARLKNEE